MKEGEEASMPISTDPVFGPRGNERKRGNGVSPPPSSLQLTIEFLPFVQDNKDAKFVSAFPGSRCEEKWA